MPNYTPWGAAIALDGTQVRAGSAEFYDLGRALSGSLFVSLPLLFTEEMWQISRSMPDAALAILLIVSLGINRLFLEFSGYRQRRWQSSPWWDTLVVTGIGLFASSVTLFVSGILSHNLDGHLIVKTILLETIPTSMGAAVAVNQLGAGDRKASGMAKSEDLNVLVGTILGGYLFAFNVAPTAETKIVTFGQNWWQVLLTCILSLLVSYMAVRVSRHEEHASKPRRFLTSNWFEAIASYLVAFAVSVGLLWLFGYVSPLDPVEGWISQAVVLAFATSLGGAAGRLIL